ncbi:uncharacterized protein ACNLHF_014221 isoform 2-T2 [Anomaloglossus baeobatrachus]|uniref:uncharacterized protein LOC142295412 isoform X2 n=1 Tax=Anomaloglossus baeobatrachus TaxID=238106 RepID=UPI003F503A49
MKTLIFSALLFYILTAALWPVPEAEASNVRQWAESSSQIERRMLICSYYILEIIRSRLFFYSNDHFQQCFNHKP